MATILDTLKKGAEYLQRHGVDEARLNMELLLAQVLKIDRMRLYLDFDRPLSRPISRPCANSRSAGARANHSSTSSARSSSATSNSTPTPGPSCLGRRRRNSRGSCSPAPGRREPRSSTSDAAPASSDSPSPGIFMREPSRSPSPTSRRTPRPDRENASRLLPAEAGVRFVDSDLFSALQGERFDLIVANLPYIPDSAETLLSREVRRDPALALYGGETGTEVMERFLASVDGHLRPGGFVAMEFGIDQAEALRRCAGEAGLESVEIRRDLDGIERFLFAVKSAPSLLGSSLPARRKTPESDMEKFIVHGGHALEGSVNISGSKNASLPILAATLLTRRAVRHPPRSDVSDTNYMLQDPAEPWGRGGARQRHRRDPLREPAQPRGPLRSRPENARVRLRDGSPPRPSQPRRVSMPGGCVIGDGPSTCTSAGSRPSEPKPASKAANVHLEARYD